MVELNLIDLTHCGLVTPYGDIDWSLQCPGTGLILPDGTKP